MHRISARAGARNLGQPFNTHQRGLRALVRSAEGVKDLISRDRREVELTTAFDDEATAAPTAEQAAAAAAPAAAAAGPPASSSSSSSKQERGRRSSTKGPKSRQQRQADMAKAAEAAAGSSADVADVAAAPSFRRCKEAIDAGLAAFQQQDYQGAIALFNLALELPGNGAYRLSGSPREYACPSDAEEHAALYNMACCYAQQRQQEAALTCLESILESGFKDIQTLQSDPDLQPLQGPALQALINKYTGIGGLFSKLLSRKEEDVLVSDDNKNKPWLLW